MRRQSAILAVLFLTACCVGPPEPKPEPSSQPVAVPPPPAPPPVVYGPDWRDWPLTPGDWRYAPSAGGSSASYGQPGLAPELVVRCVASRRMVTISRPAAGAAATGRITIRITTGETSHAAIAGADGQGWTADLPAADRTLDAMAFSRGRFMVTAPGAARLIVPAWPEFTRVVEDCR